MMASCKGMDLAPSMGFFSMKAHASYWRHCASELDAGGTSVQRTLRNSL